MQNIKDFLQGASNSVASNVSAPVDGIAWLLRKAGIPVPPNPMGGSDWMAEKGLTPQPQNRTAGLLGEAFGLSGPMVATAKVPQLAKGLLSLDDKAMDMGRNAIEKHMVKNGFIQPATVWHGSPHKFDKFDSAKIGTGEGAQAYGHGLYLADNPAVAREYQEKLSSVGGAQNLIRQNGDTTKALAEAERRIGHYQKLITDGGGGDMRRAQGMLSIAEKNATDLRAMQAGLPDNTGALYKVDLPDEQIAKMLDWDTPLSGQNEAVQAAVRKIRPGIENLSSSVGGRLQPAMGQSGEDFIEWMGRGHSDRLREAGIPGIRYLDGGSRATGGTSNYVVFPGNEDMLKILERNGKGLLE